MIKNDATNKLLIFLAVLFTAANLRAPFTSLAPLLSSLQESLGLTTSSTGLLITLPLLAFIIFSPLAPQIAKKFGLENAIYYALVLILVGIVIRSSGFIGLLYLGTFMIGIGIAIGNVLLPSVVKINFPSRIPLITSGYILSMGLFAAMGSSLVIPIEGLTSYGWKASSFIMVILPVFAIILWSFQLKNKSATKIKPKLINKNEPYSYHQLLKSPIAWQVTGFFAFNSFLYYSIVSWLPAIASSFHYSELQAGNIHGIFQLSTAIPALIIPLLMSKFKDQKLLALLMSSITLIGIVGILINPAYLFLWAAMIGFGAGACFVLAIIFIGIRTNNLLQSTLLSSLTQTLGYSIASTGPIVMGWLYDSQKNWSLALTLCITLCIAMSICGFLSGRNKTLDADTIDESRVVNQS